MPCRAHHAALRGSGHLMSPGLAQSVQTRLVRHAKAIGVDPNHVVARYATERFLHRLSRSP